LNSSLYDKELQQAKQIPWSWSKFLVSADGNVLSFYRTDINPAAIIPDIEINLKK